MGKYLEILDVGVRIAARFHSHCPQTARLYYHPPANHDDNHQQQDGPHGGFFGGKAAGDVSGRVGGFGSKKVMAVDTTDFILYSIA
ncbi:unnamed protein product [Ilex paraguariensis]|uniref:Uncharacterized protein n=3 Tax=Ilex paraguariensis TaxID=185542 RepID=A0ABC8V2E8_9AQUA